MAHRTITVRYERGTLVWRADAPGQWRIAQWRYVETVTGGHIEVAVLPKAIPTQGKVEMAWLNESDVEAVATPQRRHPAWVPQWVARWRQLMP